MTMLPSLLLLTVAEVAATSASAVSSASSRSEAGFPVAYVYRVFDVPFTVRLRALKEMTAMSPRLNEVVPLV